MDIKGIKEKISHLKNVFSDNSMVLSAIDKIIYKDESATEILEDLRIIERENGSSYIRNYIDDIKKSLNDFFKVEKEIKDMEYKISSLIDEIKTNLIKRNIDISKLDLKITTYDKNDLNRQKDYLRYLEEQFKYLNEMKDSMLKEKQVGEAFKEGFKEGEKAADGVEDIDKKAEENIKEIVDPPVDMVLTYLNYYYENRKSDNNVSLKVEKPADGMQRILTVTYFGVNVSEKDPKVKFYFNDSEYFDREVMPEVLHKYANENVTDGSVYENNKYQEASESGDTLEMENMNRDYVLDSDEYLKEEARRKRNGVRVRKDDNIFGIGNAFLIILTVLIVVMGVLLVILLRR